MSDGVGKPHMKVITGINEESDMSVAMELFGEAVEPDFASRFGTRYMKQQGTDKSRCVADMVSGYYGATALSHAIRHFEEIGYVGSIEEYLRGTYDEDWANDLIELVHSDPVSYLTYEGTAAPFIREYARSLI